MEEILEIVTNRITLDGTPIQGKDIQNTLEVFEEPSRISLILARALEKQPQINSREDFPDPYEMKDMDKAVKTFTEVIANNGRIKFILDSDMDGLGTYTLWYNFFKFFPYQNIELMITDRKQGYGFIPRHVVDGVDLYITSDNGITAVPATKVAKEKGAKVIICDHHQPDMELGLPDADAILDPFQPSDTFKYKDISGTFVLWFFLKALIDKYGIDIDPYEEFLPELALTTLSDVMPVNRHINRFVVKEFVEKFCENDNCHREYLNTFRQEINNKPTAEDFSFGLTPMINATQRMTKADHGAMFLVAEDAKSSKEWFDYLQGLNNARKERQQNLLSYIEKYYKEYIKQPFIVIPGHFHKEFKGVLGIIAGRLADRYHKPTIVLNFNDQDKTYSGSGRSTGNLNILDIIRKNPYIENVGGHKQALGVTITEDKWEDFYTTLQEDTKKIPPEILHPKKLPLGFVPINKINIDFFNEISKFEPFGQLFKKPTFVTKGIIKSAHLMGKQKNHLSMTITDKKGLITFKGVKFFTTEVPEVGKEYMINFKFDIDTFRGTGELQLKFEDWLKIDGSD
jgi:single-stranded-DNA-specific exonuclease